MLKAVQFHSQGWDIRRSSRHNSFHYQHTCCHSSNHRDDMNTRSSHSSCLYRIRFVVLGMKLLEWFVSEIIYAKNEILKIVCVNIGLP